MTVAESFSSIREDVDKLLSGDLQGAGSRLFPRAVKMFAGWVLLSCLVICSLPLASAAQTSREEEAENDIQAAKQAQQQGDYAQAVAGYQAAVKLMPEVAELYSNLGIAYYLQKDYQKAIEAFHQALKRKPALEGPNYFLGMAYIRTSRFAESIKPLQKAIAVNPKLREA